MIKLAVCPISSYRSVICSNSVTWLLNTRKTKFLTERIANSVCPFCGVTNYKSFSDRKDNRKPLKWEPESSPAMWNKEFKLKEPELNWNFLCDEENTELIERNIRNRKAGGDIRLLQQLFQNYKQESNKDAQTRLYQGLLTVARHVPNMSHPDVPVGEESCAETVLMSGSKKEFSFKPRTVVNLGENLNLLRMDHVILSTSEKMYYFIGDLVRLEQALVKFTLKKLIKKVHTRTWPYYRGHIIAPVAFKYKEKTDVKILGFELVTVPDLIHSSIIESCGFKTTGERTQVYKVNPSYHGDLCLIGTAEMPLAGYFINSNLELLNLPCRLAAVSQCYRAETSELKEERGIYRVQQFTKIEMFGVTANETGEESGNLLQELVSLQQELFSELGLHFRVLAMPTEELGTSAHRKYDFEAWMPAKSFWGEIASASDCTDYQSRRLNIKYTDVNANARHCFTDGSVNIPLCLQPYMNGQTTLTKWENAPDMKWNKFSKLKPGR